MSDKQNVVGKIIVFVGIIAAGKSTGAKNAQAYNKDAVIFEEPSIENPYLALFYREPKKYGYVMQKYLFQNRKKSYIKAIELSNKGIDCILDTCVHFDWVYAYLNYKYEGNISKGNFDKYKKEYDNVLEKLRKPDIIIHLKCSPEVAYLRNKRRSESVEGRECESVIPLSYFQNQKKSLKFWLDSMEDKSRIIHLDWNMFGISLCEDIEDCYYYLKSFDIESMYQDIFHKDKKSCI